MKKLMIRADDLGYSEAINFGIEKTVKEGIINNVGFMVNMPASIHGFKRIQNENIALGQHTNICVGKPLSNPDKIKSIVTAEGFFKSSKEYRNAKQDFVDLEEVILEIEAQYEMFKRITGREPDYFEGHAIESENFLKGLEFVAKKYGLKYQGVSFDGTPTYIHDKKMYMWMDSMNTAYDPENYLMNMFKNNHKDGYDMMIFHPGYLDDFILKSSSLTVHRTLEVEVACSTYIKQYIKENDITLLKYTDI